MQVRIPSVLASLALTAAAAAQPTAFTYQGQLKNAGTLASGAHDLRFRLFDAPALGSQIGPSLCADNVAISDGLFTVDLDFGAAFPGPQRFLEIEVRADTGLDCTNLTGFVPLAPRQELTPTPYAIFAANSAAAVNASQLNGQAPAFYQNAANISTGTLGDSRLSTNVSLLNSVQTFSGAKTFSGGLLTTSFALPTGAAAGRVLTSNAAGAGSWQDPTLLLPFAGSAFVNPPDAVLQMTNTSAGVALRGVSSGNGTGVAGISTAASGVNQGVYGSSASNTGTGVFGEVTSPTGSTYGGKFFCASQTGMGIYAEATALSGVSHGGQFVSNSTNGIGVNGYASATTGTTIGGIFQSDSTSGYGLISNSMATTGTTHAGYFFNRSTAGTAVKGLATATTGANYGGYFQTDSATGTGLFARTTLPGGVALQADAPAGGKAAIFTGGNVGIGTTTPLANLDVRTTGQGIRIQGALPGLDNGAYLAFANGAGTDLGYIGDGSSTDNSMYLTSYANDIYLYTAAGAALTAKSSGNVGIGTTTPGAKLDVQSAGAPSLSATTSSSIQSAAAVFGQATAASGATYGVHGRSTSTSGRGVNGFASSTTGTTTGVYGRSESSSGRGVVGDAFHSSGSVIGVLGFTHSTAGVGVKGIASSSSGTGIGVWGVGDSPTGWGVYADGRLGASGTKSFRIDHPADPENKYLMHYCPESPEVLNFYRGTVTLDNAGDAIVELPSYFASINKDPSYQLTGLGAPMPLLHIARGIDTEALRAGAEARLGVAAPPCSFRIAGGVPGAKVCWRVEAARNDAWVRTHGAPVEVEKEDRDKGTYQHPELHGRSNDKR